MKAELICSTALFFSLTFNFALETCAYALFGRDVKIQDGEKDEFMEALQIMANVPDGGDLDALLKLNILQSELSFQYQFHQNVFTWRERLAGLKHDPHMTTLATTSILTPPLAG